MKNLKKQILSASVAASLVASLAPATMAAIPSDVAGTRYEEPVQILSALKIMIGDENGKFRLDDTIIRSEVAKMAIHALGLEDAAAASKGQTIFDDVSENHWANGYINLAVSQGIIEGDGDGNFRPNAPITYAEAMTIMVKVTGYGEMAKKQGGYPNGFIKVGTSNGLAKNVQGSSREEISRGNVAYLTTNALEVNLMEQTGFGSGIQYEITDKTLLKDNLNVTKGTGQVTAIDSTSLDGSSKVGKGKIKIDDKVFEVAHNMNDLLGYNVTYYLKEEKSDSQIILAMPIKSQNKDLIINAKQFAKLTEKDSETVIEYFKDDNSSKTETVKIPSDASLIYNGKYEQTDISLLDMTDKSGSVTLLDANKDGKYEIVFVKDYNNIVVEEVTSSNKIVDKYSDTVLKLDDSVDFRITNGLDEIELADLNEFDVLSVAESLDKKLCEILVTRKSVTGKVTGKDKDGVVIDGKKYEIAQNYTNDIQIGTEGTFYFDIDGNIAAVDTASKLSSNYGYLIRAFFSKDTDKKSTFKIFTKDGKEVTLNGRDKIKFNGKSGVKAEDVVNAINDENNSTPEQLITYTTNADNQISAINTAVDNTETGAVNSKQFTKNYNLKDAKFSKSLSKLGNVRIDENTIIFDIPEGSDEYSIGNIDVFEDEQKYNAIVYDMSDNYTASAIVVTNAQFKANADAPIAVVKDIMDASNDDDEQTHMLTALVDGKEVSLYAKDSDVLVKGTKKLEKGDIIQYKTNSDKEIVSIRLLLDISTKDTESTSSPAEKLETVYGRVTKKFSNSINVTVNGQNETNYSFPSDVTVYSIDTTKSRNNVTVADTSDIQKYDADENNRVFIKLYDNTVKEIVIVK